MPQSTWIQGVEMIPEGRPYKVDTSSRIIVPAHLKAKFGIDIGDDMDYYTAFANGKWFICVTKHIPTEEELAAKAAKEAAKLAKSADNQN